MDVLAWDGVKAAVSVKPCFKRLFTLRKQDQHVQLRKPESDFLPRQSATARFGLQPKAFSQVNSLMFVHMLMFVFFDASDFC